MKWRAFSRMPQWVRLSEWLGPSAFAHIDHGDPSHQQNDGRGFGYRRDDADRGYRASKVQEFIRGCVQVFVVERPIGQPIEGNGIWKRVISEYIVTWTRKIDLRIHKWSR